MVHPHAALAIDDRKTDFRQLKALGNQRQEMRSLNYHALAYHQLPLTDQALLILVAAIQQLPIKLGKVCGLGDRDQVVAPEISNFPFDPTFLMPLRGLTKLRGKSPVRAKSNETFMLEAGVTP